MQLGHETESAHIHLIVIGFTHLNSIVNVSVQVEGGCNNLLFTSDNFRRASAVLACNL